MEITINGEPRQLVGNPPEVGDEFPHFKRKNLKISKKSVKKCKMFLECKRSYGERF